MTFLVRGGGWPPLKALAMALGACVLIEAPASAGNDGVISPWSGCAPGAGTLGYGPPGVFPGFQGFGLGYHPGYGYGGKALGVGAEGGYPFYGGPGYPHPEPPLRRRSGILPFPYYGGPGGPCPGSPQYFGGPGPLVGERPVVTMGDGGLGYGGFTGGPPNAEAVFAPFTSAAAAGGSYSGVIAPPHSPDAPQPPGATAPPPPGAIPLPVPGPASAPVPPAAARPLGIEVEPVAEAGEARGLKISQVRPGTAAEKAGLHPGDVIYQINGYFTKQHGNLAWILANAAPNRVLEMSVRTASDGKERTVTALLR